MRRRFWFLLAIGSGLVAAKPAPPPRPKVLVIAVDGASANVLDDLTRRGRMPHVARLFQECRSAPIDTGEGNSPVKWTTLFSGRPVSDHGVTDFRIDGQGLSSAHCRVRRVWEILSDQGWRVGVFCPLATWPVQPLNGVIVADRWHPFKSGRPNVASPPSLTERLHEPLGRTARRLGLSDPPRDVPRLFDPDVPLPDSPDDLDVASHTFARQRYEAARLMGTTYLQETLVSDLAERLERETPFDFLVIYLRGVDYVSHHTWAASVVPTGGDVAVRAGSPVEIYYRFVDRVVGRLMKRMPSDAHVFFLSDHGFLSEPKSPPRDFTTTGEHSKYGVFALKGPGIPPGRGAAVVDALDVAPTWLALFGASASDTMPGRPLPPVRETAPRVPDYPHTPPAFIPPPLAQEERRQLEQLNYLK